VRRDQPLCTSTSEPHPSAGPTFIFLIEDYFAMANYGDGSTFGCENLKCAWWDGVYLAGPLPQCTW
jgi:hypothetical protein